MTPPISRCDCYDDALLPSKIRADIVKVFLYSLGDNDTKSIYIIHQRRIRFKGKT